MSCVLVLPLSWGGVAVAVWTRRSSVQVSVRGKRPRTCGGGCTTNLARTLSAVVHCRRCCCCPLSSLSLLSIVVILAVVRTAWPIGQSRRRQRRQSSLSVGAAAALLMGANAHVQVVSAGSGLDAAMYAPVLVVDTPPFSHLRHCPSRLLLLLSESCEPSLSS